MLNLVDMLNMLLFMNICAYYNIYIICVDACINVKCVSDESLLLYNICYLYVIGILSFFIL